MGATSDDGEVGSEEPAELDEFVESAEDVVVAVDLTGPFAPHAGTPKAPANRTHTEKKIRRELLFARVTIRHYTDPGTAGGGDQTMG